MGPEIKQNINTEGAEKQRTQRTNETNDEGENEEKGTNHLAPGSAVWNPAFWNCIAKRFFGRQDDSGKGYGG
jgi:hypothetical protein